MTLTCPNTVNPLRRLPAGSSYIALCTGESPGHVRRSLAVNGTTMNLFILFHFISVTLMTQSDYIWLISLSVAALWGQVPGSSGVHITEDFSWTTYKKNKAQQCLDDKCKPSPSCPQNFLQKHNREHSEQQPLSLVEQLHSHRPEVPPESGEDSRDYNQDLPTIYTGSTSVRLP